MGICKICNIELYTEEEKRDGICQECVETELDMTEVAVINPTTMEEIEDGSPC